MLFRSVAGAWAIRAFRGVLKVLLPFETISFGLATQEMQLANTKLEGMEVKLDDITPGFHAAITIADPWLKLEDNFGWLMEILGIFERDAGMNPFTPAGPDEEPNYNSYMAQVKQLKLNNVMVMQLQPFMIGMSTEFEHNGEAVTGWENMPGFYVEYFKLRSEFGMYGSDQVPSLGAAIRMRTKIAIPTATTLITSGEGTLAKADETEDGTVALSLFFIGRFNLALVGIGFIIQVDTIYRPMTPGDKVLANPMGMMDNVEIGRASCRERV